MPGNAAETETSALLGFRRNCFMCSIRLRSIAFASTHP
jgi:hypothetical protein